MSDRNISPSAVSEYVRISKISSRVVLAACRTGGSEQHYRWHRRESRVFQLFGKFEEMMGFEKPDSGSVFFGQYNLQNVNMGSLRQYVGYCPQAMQVFPGTIADNIRLAAPMSTDDEVWEAARIASLDEDIRKMPLQMDTLVGEGGSGLSGGQCQRLLIARAVRLTTIT